MEIFTRFVGATKTLIYETYGLGIMTGSITRNQFDQFREKYENLDLGDPSWSFRLIGYENVIYGLYSEILINTAGGNHNVDVPFYKIC